MGTYLYLQPVCIANADCGATYESVAYCQENVVVKDTVTPQCVNADSFKAKCQEQRKPTMVESCMYPYACSDGACIPQSCYQLSDAVWLGGPAVSRIFFDSPKNRSQVSILAMKTGAEFNVQLFTDREGQPVRTLKIWDGLNDNSIDESGWITLSMQGVESIPSGYYWLGIEVVKYGDGAFNTCVRNDRKEDTYGSDNVIVDGIFTQTTSRNEHDIVYIFE